MFTNKDMLNALLKLQERVQEGTHCDVLGICSNLSSVVTEADAQRTCNRMLRNAFHIMGLDKVYPVEDMLGVPAEQLSYHYTTVENKWDIDTEYGQARRILMRMLITYFN